MGWSGPLPHRLCSRPTFLVNNEYVTAEITYSTAHVHHKAPVILATLCSPPYEPSPWKPWLRLHWGYTGAASWLCYGRLYSDCCPSCCVIREGGCVMAAVPARGVPTAPQVFQLRSSHLAYPGPANSADSVNSKTTGAYCNKISSTHENSSLTQLSFHHGLTEVVNQWLLG